MLISDVLIMGERYNFKLPVLNLFSLSRSGRISNSSAHQHIKKKCPRKTEGHFSHKQ